jgi:hypothetical protein
MKRKALAVVLIAIVALFITTWIIHNQISELQNQIGELQAQNSDLQDQISELLSGNYTRVNVTITAVKSGNWEYLGGLAMIKLFNMTIANLENRDIRGLRVEVNFIANGSEIQTDTMFFGSGIIGDGAQIESFDGLLRAGEVRELRGAIQAPVNNLHPARVKVMLGDSVLDEWIDPI